jgi:hypothetical protein
MILEARVKKTEKGAVLAVIDNKVYNIKQIPGDRDYNNVCHRLRSGEKVFLDQASKGEFRLIINFDSGMEDFFFQRMFGKARNKAAKGDPIELLREYLSKPYSKKRQRSRRKPREYQH